MWNTPPSPPAPDQAPSPASALMEGGLQLGVPLSPHTVARLVLYLQELVRWNAKVNLSGLTEEADIITKHFLDSLAAFKVLKVGPGLIRPGPGLRVLDVGTGAGFPGLVLKLHDPELAITLLAPSPSSSSPQEANQTRRIVSFLRVALIQAATRAATCLPLAERSTAAADQRQDPLLVAAFVLPSLFHVEQCRFVDTFSPNC